MNAIDEYLTKQELIATESKLEAFRALIPEELLQITKVEQEYRHSLLVIIAEEYYFSIYSRPAASGDYEFTYEDWSSFRDNITGLYEIFQKQISDAESTEGLIEHLQKGHISSWPTCQYLKEEIDSLELIKPNSKWANVGLEYLKQMKLVATAAAHEKTKASFFNSILSLFRDK